MRIKVCASGLKATTRQHGLTEYWANRITHCCAPKNYPRIFCWTYRHEGRKLKHELRCHAILCSKEKIVHDICDTLKVNGGNHQLFPLYHGNLTNLTNYISIYIDKFGTSFAGI